MSAKNFLTTEKIKDLNEKILIVDKENFLGSGIINSLKNQARIVFVSAKPFSYSEDDKNILYISYHKKTLSLPDLVYSLVFVVCEDKDTVDLLPKFLEKAEKDNTRILVLFHFKNANEKLINKILSFRNSSIVLFGDIFGKDSFYPGRTNDLIQSALKEERVRIKNMGLKKMFPVFYDHAIEFILETALTDKNKNKILYLYPKTPPTELSFARAIQKQDPIVRVDFVSEKESEEIHIQKGDYEIESSLLEKKIKETMEFHREKSIDSFTSDMRSDLKFLKEKGQSSKKSFIFKFFINLVLAILILPTFSLILSLFLGAKSLSLSFENLKNGNIDKAKKNAYLSTNFFSLSNLSFEVLKKEADFFITNSLEEKVSKKIRFGKNAADGVFYAIDSLVKIKSAIGGSKDNSEEIEGIVASLKKTNLILQEIRLGDDLKDLKVDKTQFSFLSNPFFNVLDSVPSLIGLNKEKKYLILFQNNMELRPGGGFIGSYGLLKIKNGKIIDFSINDVYDADGQLKGHVEPPFAIRRHIPIVHYYLRDSNFDVDFPRAASASAFLLNKETGEAVDGVIAVDVTFLKKLLKVTGPVKVIDYDENVNYENFYMIAQKHSEKNFFPGSSQKKDFLRSLFTSLESSFRTNKISYLELSKAINDSTEEKHIIFAFSNKGVQKQFAANNFSSSIWDGREKDEKKINDFLGINEANLGVNKTNFFIKRQVKYEVAIDKEGNISAKITVGYKNDSDGWPGGDYKNYLRFILPKDSKISSIAIDNKEQKIIPAIIDPKIYEAKNFKVSSGLEVEETEEEGKSVFGFLVNVPMGKIGQIEVSYILPEKVKLEAAFSYSLKYFKQPGTEEYPFSFKLNYPDKYRVFNKSSEVKETGDRLEFSSIINKDFDLQFDFSKK